ncbi:hypothetical protein [uncultured Rikenella sp.]|uniref:hypothetical protein n=1 Tax=uncultured Rikenella sp. TaxID=368003 RepID=UPI002614F77D|nr:hypothetical protein [uncultured Rikenella sp.]
MRKTLYAIVLAVFAASSTANEASAREKFDRGITVQTFMPKGMWFFGGNISYTQHNNDDFQMFGLLKDFSSRGYTFAVRPMAGYSFANNLAAGVAFTYERSMLQIDNVSLALGDLSFDVSDYYNIEHVYTGTIFLRNYINLGNSRRFALINDLKLQLGGGQGKMIDGAGDDMSGTYTKIYKLGLVCSPGVAVFVNDFAAVEATIGVLGFQYKRTEQTTDQIHHASRQTSGANFKIDIFSIALGMTFYL